MQIFVGIQNVVGLLQITVQWYVAIPHQILVNFATSAPYTKQMPDETNDRHDTEAHIYQDKHHPFKPCHFLIVITTTCVIASLKGLILLVLKRIILPNGWLKHTFWELYHQVESGFRTHRLGGLCHNGAVLKSQLALESESPDTTTVRINDHCRICGGDGYLGVFGFR